MATKFFLNLCQRGSHSAPSIHSGPRPYPLQSFVLGRFELVGCDAFKQFVSASDSSLSAIYKPNSTLLVPLHSICLGDLLSLLMQCYFKGSIEASLLSFTVVTFISNRTATFDTGSRIGNAEITGGSIFYLTAGIFTSTSFSSN